MVAITLLTIIVLIQSAIAIESDHVVFSIVGGGGEGVARRLANDHNLRYVSQVNSYIISALMQ